MTRTAVDYIIAPVGIDHLAAMGRVMANAFDPRFGEAWSKAQCLAVLALPGYRLRGAYRRASDAGSLMGFAITRAVADESELLLLAVDPYFRRAGVGRRLLAHWLTHCSDNTICRAFLEVRASNPAIELYEKSGFSCIGNRPNYYRGVDGATHDAVTMEKLLGQTVSSGKA